MKGWQVGILTALFILFVAYMSGVGVVTKDPFNALVYCVAGLVGCAAGTVYNILRG